MIHDSLSLLTHANAGDMQMCEYLNLPDVDIRCNTDMLPHLVLSPGSGPSMSWIIGHCYIWTLARVTVSTHYIIGLLEASFIK